MQFENFPRDTVPLIVFEISYFTNSSKYVTQKLDKIAASAPTTVHTVYDKLGLCGDFRLVLQQNIIIGQKTG